MRQEQQRIIESRLAAWATPHASLKIYDPEAAAIRALVEELSALKQAVRDWWYADEGSIAEYAARDHMLDRAEVPLHAQV